MCTQNQHKTHTKNQKSRQVVLWVQWCAQQKIFKKILKNKFSKKKSPQVMLCFNGGPDKVASFVLLCIMIGATYTHHVADEPVIFFFPLVS
jgi:hypothetical protein